ncbi:hypothetical protein [Mesonia aestuariivivens]|uniref:Glycerophosphoryl diester phosphodiesterase membrane domain-containing protein n=1 Tax=Mesonia aestuariivivens TaxID=2796128 RepID=A0ABS6VY56_9FLAO|nr:hypothetical protein [Mesonia aestuariivivens]MBW2960520.1 hypothetical protein [Mesonia aestuariivivens]
MHKFIPFKKERELGDILSDTFKFTRENYKPLLKALVKFTGPVFLLQLFALGYYNYTTVGSSLFSNSLSGFNLGFNMVLSFLFLMLSSIAYQAFMYGTIQQCIRSYIKNDGNISIDEVSEGMSKNWSSYLGLGFGITIMISIGTMFCFLPGIYLAVPLSLVYSIRTFDELNFSETISHTFNLIKNNWWITFFTLFLMFIIVYLISMIFQIPALIYTIVKTMTVVQEGSYSDPNAFFDWVYLILTVVGSAISYVIYGILAICVAFIYFNLNEEKNHTGAYEEIDNLGKEE